MITYEKVSRKSKPAQSKNATQVKAKEGGAKTSDKKLTATGKKTKTYKLVPQKPSGSKGNAIQVPSNNSNMELDMEDDSSEDEASSGSGSGSGSESDE